MAVQVTLLPRKLSVCAPERNAPVCARGCNSAQVLSAICLLFLIFPIAYLVVYPSLYTANFTLHSFHDAPALNVVTLSFNQPHEQPIIEHNCAMVSKTRHRFLIYTDDLSQKFCSVCQCVKFVKSNCVCPSPDKHGCALCEKLKFFSEKIPELGEMLFLDNDLIVLKDQFWDMIYARSRVHDFLAGHGHMKPDPRKYFAPFNSGLLFIRALPGIDYGAMTGPEYATGNNDQNAVTKFIFDHYENWDSLSIKWHCRFLKAERYSIPVDECYTLHDRREWKDIFKSMNRTLLRIE